MSKKRSSRCSSVCGRSARIFVLLMCVTGMASMRSAQAQVFEDCNGNNIPDECDLENGTACVEQRGEPCEAFQGICQSSNCNFDSIPDECQDCDSDGIPNDCEIHGDCPTSCCGEQGEFCVSDDFDSNGVPDECDFEDCNSNGVRDDCDIATGTNCQAGVCNRFKFSCEQEDCNNNQVIDLCEDFDDCNGNSVPDECDLARHAYISNTDSDEVWVVSLLSQSVVAVVDVGDDPRGIDIAPDNSRVYVANRFDDSISVIDTSTNTLQGTIDLGASIVVTATEPYDVVVSPDGEWLYVAMKNGGSENGDGTVVVVDLPSGNIVAEVILDSDASPEGIVVTPDGQKVYVAGRGDMYIVDVSTPTSPVFLGKSGDAGRELVVSPDGAWVYANANVVRTSDDAAFGIGESSGERGISVSPDGLTLFSTDGNNDVKVVSVDLSGATPTTSSLGNIDGDPTQFESYGIDLTDEGDLGVVSYRNSDTVRIFDASALSFISPPIPMTLGTGKGTISGREPKQLVISHSVDDLDGDGVPDECIGCALLDAVFVVDTSGSIQDEGQALCDNIQKVVRDLAGKGTILNASLLGIFENPKGSSFECLTGNVADVFGTAVPGVPPALGLSLNSNEDWASAVAIVAERFPWTPEALRVIIPISDEAPEDGEPCDDPGLDRAAITNAQNVANLNMVAVAPITGDGTGACAKALAQELAGATGGIAVASMQPATGGLADAVIEGILLGVCSGEIIDRLIADRCPADPGKVDPGVCGCGVPDVDNDGDNLVDCPRDSGQSAPVEPACALCGTVGVVFYLFTVAIYGVALVVRRGRR